ncbi:PREDICTED: DNA replication complex GINS protein PSF2 isoform X2 [Lupinus angustifolius]|uniref:DNA replication complex GINS protein PSF2 isoform X2 n=1 Tax=Lupinus angustifolius TaxID=3871 RepID=UPI00092EB6CE|nr:PREDICTED: DNA replication complex GINS protein PSF2 isoform X2 [Lupinus angustifolius]
MKLSKLFPISRCLLSISSLEILVHLPPRLLLKYRCGWLWLSRREASAPFALLNGCLLLTQVLEAERDSQEMSEQLPFHYVEISRLLFEHARDNIPDVYMVRSLIEDIRDVRFHKVETDLEAFSGRTIAVKIKNLSAMEVNIVRPFIGRALQAFYKHDSPDLIPDPERVSDSRPQVVNNAPRRQLRR